MMKIACWDGCCCPLCDVEPIEEENDLEKAQRRSREERALRKAGKPTLCVSLSDILTAHALKEKKR
jgi:hypothetical protein